MRPRLKSRRGTLKKSPSISTLVVNAYMQRGTPVPCQNSHMASAELAFPLLVSLLSGTR